VRPGATLLTATIALAIVAVCAAPDARAVVVTVVVESTDPPQALFSGPVDTEPHPVDGGDGSGAHQCSGPPGENPAATATGALDDAMRAAAIPWRGNWDPSFDDFFIDRIGPYASAAPDDYWALTVNGRFSSGGCLARVSAGDAIRFAYGPLFGAPPESEPAPTSPPAGQGATGPTGPTSATRRRARALRGIARRAALFLRNAGGVGSDWADLALALRSRHGLMGAARRLGERLRRLPGRRSVGHDVDLTALAAWSLAVRGRQVEARRAATLVRSAQAADGGFPAVPGGSSNAQSTGVALVALRVAGLGSRPTPTPGGPTPLDYLASLARRNGSIAYRPGSNLTPVWTTAQALLGLTARARLLALGTTGRAG
jgi:hypothetical protein